MARLDEALVIVEPDLGVEALAATDRTNTLPLSDPWEDSFVAEQRVDGLDESLADLQSGERMLLDENALGAFKTYRRHPELDPLAPQENQTLVPTGLATLQQYALYEIGERFRLHIVERDDGLLVAELVSR